MQLAQLVTYLDDYLRAREIPDYPHALNGLQVESPADVARVAVAVDASERAIQDAIVNDCNLLIVHHGLFWNGLQPLTGRGYRKIKACLAAELAVYASHIPLDLHPEVGNSVVLGRAIGLNLEGDWGDYRGHKIGIWGTLKLSREALTARLDEVLGGPVRLLPGGGERVEKVGVITGAGASYISEAQALGLDALVTGEGAHHTYFDAIEGGINVFYGGHYRTEVWGVRALAEHLEQQFGIPWRFLDHPTGL
ncbi:MAG: Nif3-like dinuclear metal center hexameric protein [Longimicrobiales bacterium]